MLDRKTGITIGAGVVVIIIVILLIGGFSWRGGKPGSGQATVPAPVYAPKGDVVSGFPRELILKDNAVINSSYSISYSANQYTAQWNSSSSIDSLSNQYKTFLTDNGWKVTISTSTATWLRGVSGVKDDAYVLVNIAAQGKGSQITITYVKK